MSCSWQRVKPGGSYIFSHYDEAHADGSCRKMKNRVKQEEGEKNRELHQRQKESIKSLQTLESRLCKVVLDDEETL